MKQTLSKTGCVLVIASALMFIASQAVFAGDVVPAKEAVKYLDKKTYTKAQIRDYYRALKKKTVKGDGKVADVRKVRRNYEICVMVKGTKYERACNLIVNTSQEDAVKLNKGQKISFEGQFIRLTPFVNYYVIIKGSYKKIK